jgi:hypothetical protein
MAIRWAETRQAIAALLAVGSEPAHPLREIPADREAVLRFLNGLPWGRNPWHAGSQAAHLVFFLHTNAVVFGEHDQRSTLVPVIADFLERLQDSETGAWVQRGKWPWRAPVAWQVNGAMKVIAGYHWMGTNFGRPEALIDLCLESVGSRDACHRLDPVYVLHACSRRTDHRAAEVQSAAGRTLAAISEHRRPDGGLSFFRDHANTSYYGVPVSHGLDESDVHGTHLLIWAATLCADLLGFSSALSWRMPVT